MNNDVQRELVRAFSVGDLSRREFIARATALGLSASAAASLLTA